MMWTFVSKFLYEYVLLIFLAISLGELLGHMFNSMLLYVWLSDKLSHFSTAAESFYIWIADV